MSDQIVHRSSQPSESVRSVPGLDRLEAEPFRADRAATDLFTLYEKVIKNQPDARDAEIFEKIHQWSFSDFALSAHDFAEITKADLDSWQKRNRINLSAGCIRPEPIDLQRGYAWGHIRMAIAVNRLHEATGPPSVDEIKLAWSKKD